MECYIHIHAVYADLNSLAFRREEHSCGFSVILWILLSVSTLHPDPRQLPQSVDPPKPLPSVPTVPSAVVPSYSMECDSIITTIIVFYRYLND